MTVNDLALVAVGLLGEDNADDYQVIPNVNVLLAENFDLNNSIRVYRELDKLTTPQTVTSDEDVLTYEWEVLRVVIPYGLAANFKLDDDINIANSFRNQYAYWHDYYKKFEVVTIEDVYGLEEE